MRHLLNTLFVNSEDIYLSLDGENVVASRGKQEMARYPLHILSGICAPYRLLLLRRRLSGADGGLCPEGCVSGVLHAPGTVSRPGIRGILRECAAAADTVPDSR